MFKPIKVIHYWPNFSKLAHTDATVQFAELDSEIEVSEGDMIQFTLVLNTPGSGQLQVPITVSLTAIDGDKASMYMYNLSVCVCVCFPTTN